MDILDNARSVLSYTEGMAYNDYLANSLVQDASERCLARISEAAIKLGAFAPDLLPEHDWPNIRGIGNLLRHDYDKLNIDRIWLIIELHLQPLINGIEAAMQAHGIPEE